VYFHGVLEGENTDASANFLLAVLYHTEQDPKTEPVPGNLRMAALVDCVSSHHLSMHEVLWLSCPPLLERDC